MAWLYTLGLSFCLQWNSCLFLHTFSIFMYFKIIQSLACLNECKCCHIHLGCPNNIMLQASGDITLFHIRISNAPNIIWNYEESFRESFSTLISTIRRHNTNVLYVELLNYCWKRFVHLNDDSKFHSTAYTLVSPGMALQEMVLAWDQLWLILSPKHQMIIAYTKMCHPHHSNFVP